MAEALRLTERPAGAGIVAPGRHGRREGAAGLLVHEVAGFGLATLQAKGGRTAELIERVAASLGVRPPEGPGRVDGVGVALIGTGPGRWLALAAPRPRAWPQPLLAAVSASGAVTDQSGAQALFRLSGPAVLDVLATGVPVDLDPRVFPPGSAATTVVAHVGVTLWRTADGIELLVPRSFVGSFWHWLEAGSARHGLVATSGS